MKRVYSVGVVLAIGMLLSLSDSTGFDKKQKRSRNTSFGVPYISEVKPSSARVGEKVEIEGANFLGANLSVTFNGVRAVIKKAEADELRVFVPSGATSGPLLVSVGEKKSNAVHFVVEGTKEISPVTIATPSQPAVPKTDSATNERSNTSPLVSFSKKVQPIFDNHCTSCHGGSAGLTLDDGESFANLVNVPAQKSCAGEMRVAPGKPDASVLYKKVSGTSCGTQMPKKAPPLSAEDIQLIMSWIEEGALNN